jgi:hypothetical protein
VKAMYRKAYPRWVANDSSKIEPDPRLRVILGLRIEVFSGR